jgi:acyl-CoA thioesterase FadM
VAVPLRIEEPYRVRFDECGADGLARASVHLRWAQDVAWRHSELAGFDRAWYAAQGLTWLVRCLGLELEGTVASADAVTVSTQVVGFRRVWARRVSEVRRAPGRELVATVTTDWVLLGPRGLPVRVPDEILDAFPGRMPDFQPARVSLDEPPAAAAAAVRPLAVRRHELDPMGHVNHAVYLDWLEESIAEAGGERELDARPRRYALEYERSAAPGSAPRAVAWRGADGAWSWLLDDTTGTALARAHFQAG